MKKILITAPLLCILSISFAQKAGSYIRNGNKLYKQNNFAGSESEYKKALVQSPDHPLANYNLGNAQFRNNELDEAVGSYDNTVKNNSSKKPVVEQAYYNKGVAFSKQQKLQESIDAWKNALKINSADREARENLQKALLEQKKQQQQQKQDKKEDEKKDDKKDKKQQEKKDKEQQPQQPQSKLSKKQVEQLLKALAQKENEVQQKMQQKNTGSAGRQEKDW